MAKKTDSNILANLEELKNIFHTYDQAGEALREEYFRHQDEFKNKDTHHHFSILPYLVMLAFTIELGIKSLYYRENNKEWPSHKISHNLKRGYNILSQPLKDRIREETCRPSHSGFNILEEDFDKELSENADTFQNVRYYFENGLQSPVKYSFLYKLKEVVKEELLSTS